MKREELMVAAIENGTVIDHIPPSKLAKVLALLRLDSIPGCSYMVGNNLHSKKMGLKSIIKISDLFFSPAELNQLSVVAPHITLCVIRDYEVAEKKRVELPEHIRGIVRCANPKCITNNEPMTTLFHVTQPSAGIIKCHYCEKEQSLDHVRFCTDHTNP